ncbi:MAG: diguanylate cyclase [Gemmatimonadaceae bacterium]|nr:diguanylate cyclase [Gemmatimonadaceae bacterium]
MNAMRNGQILVADDDPSVLDSLSTVLRDSGFDVRIADGRESLLRELRLGTPDLLLLDVIMPGADGIQVLQELKRDSRWRDIPVLMISSLSPDGVTEKTFGLGAADFIRKPFRPRELIARVQAQLRLHRELTASRAALTAAEDELRRAREDAESRRKMVDILHEVTGDLATDEIYPILARRVARALNLSRCSVILAKPGDAKGVVATAFDDPALRDFEIHLDRYPEIRQALDTGEPVLIEDLQVSDLHNTIRQEWQAQGTKVPIRSVIVLPLKLGEEQAGVFFLRRMESEPPLTREDVEFADAVVKAAVGAIGRARLIETTRAENTRLEVLARTDPLTQVLNRRALTMQLVAEMDRARRYGTDISVLMVDLDHFKRVNDTMGHLVGDDVLRELARLLQQSVRSVDFVARYGGEEFVAVLPETALAGAVVFAERLRERIAATKFVPAHGGVYLTASIGVASYPAPEIHTVDDMIARADEALYRAKEQGRNRVCQ